jgi:hypothetical protein
MFPECKTPVPQHPIGDDMLLVKLLCLWLGTADEAAIAIRYFVNKAWHAVQDNAAIFRLDRIVVESFELHNRIRNTDSIKWVPFPILAIYLLQYFAHSPDRGMFSQRVIIRLCRSVSDSPLISPVDAEALISDVQLSADSLLRLLLVYEKQDPLVSQNCQLPNPECPDTFLASVDIR